MAGGGVKAARGGMSEVDYMAVLTVGKFTICHYPDGGFWIGRTDADRAGEGMQIPTRVLDNLIDAYYRVHL